MQGHRLLTVILSLLKTTLQRRTTAVLYGVMVVLTMVTMGTRIAVVQGDVNSFQPVYALIEHMTPRGMLAHGYRFSALPPPSSFRDPASVLFSESASFESDVPIETPEGLLVVALPFIALLIGASLSPRRDGPVLTLLSAPIRRVTFYLAHAVALIIVLALVCAAAWIGGCTLLLLTMPNPWQLIQLLTLLLSYSLLYAIVFGGIGLSFGVLFTKRVTSLMAGLLLIMVLVGVMPSLREMSGRTYASNHREEFIEYIEGGAVPTDLAWSIDRAIQHTPANAIRTIFWITESYSPDSRPGCMYCGSLQKPGRGYRVAGGVIALTIAAMISLAIGGFAFLCREEGTA
ncbi:ABC transporter permease subunit [Candidatus Bipolaricaulota bacterium]|nr:ABC transporter permease subunit [Candidatus Bipolaricaulota bacterium]